MKYLVIKNTVAEGRMVRAGDIVELDSATARILIGYGKVAPYTESEFVAPEVQFETRETRRRGRPARNSK